MSANPLGPLGKTHSESGSGSGSTIAPDPGTTRSDRDGAHQSAMHNMEINARGSAMKSDEERELHCAASWVRLGTEPEWNLNSRRSTTSCGASSVLFDIGVHVSVGPHWRGGANHAPIHVYTTDTPQRIEHIHHADIKTTRQPVPDQADSKPDADDEEDRTEQQQGREECRLSATGAGTSSVST